MDRKNKSFLSFMNKTVLLTVLFSLMIGVQQVTLAQSSSKQGALLYYFSKFIQWPERTTGDRFVIGVYGDVDVYNSVSKAMTGKIIEGKQVLIKRFSSVSQIIDCKVLYLAPNKSSSFYRVESVLKNTNTLLITQKDGLGAKGSHINLTVVDGRMKFELNKTQISKSGLKVSSALIKQAIIL